MAGEEKGTSFILSNDLKRRFRQAVAKLDGVNRSEVVRALITRWVEEQERGTGPSAKSIIKSDNQEIISSNLNVSELTQKPTKSPVTLVPLPELGDKEWISLVESILRGEPPFIDPLLATALKYNLLAFEGRAYERLGSADAPDRRAGKPDAVALHREVAERIHDFAARASDGKRDIAGGEKRTSGKTRKRRGVS